MYYWLQILKILSKRKLFGFYKTYLQELRVICLLSLSVCPVIGYSDNYLNLYKFIPWPVFKLPVQKINQWLDLNFKFYQKNSKLLDKLYY